MNCQTDINDSVGRTVSESPSSGVSMMPHSGLRICRQMNPTITTDSVVGMKIAVR